VFAQANKFAVENRNAKQFDDAVAELNLNKQSAPNLAENDRQIPGLSSARRIIKWAFESKSGQVSDVFEIDNSYVVAVVKKVRKEGFASIEDVRNEVEFIIRRDKKAEIIAAQLSEGSSNVHSFSELALNLGLPVETAAGISFSSFSVPGVGVEPKLVGSVSAVSEGNISRPVEGNNGVYMFTVKQITEPDATGVLQTSERLAMTYFNRSKIDQGGRLNQSSEPLQAIRNAGKIEDLRSKFY